MNMQIRSCIFDLDGVLVDTAQFHFLAWRKLANVLGFDFSEEQNEQLKGVSRRGSLETILRWGDKTLSEEEFEDWMKKKNEWYLDMVNHLSPKDLFVGVLPFIQQLRNLGIHVALGSASRNANTILSKLEINPLFDRIIDGNAVKNGKPAPDTFLLAIEGTDIDPSESIVFEDSAAGIEAANTGGFFSVGIGDQNSLPEADIVITDFKDIDLTQLITRLLNSRNNSQSTL